MEYPKVLYVRADPDGEDEPRDERYYQGYSDFKSFAEAGEVAVYKLVEKRELKFDKVLVGGEKGSV